MTEISKALNTNGNQGIQFLPDYNPIFHLFFADDLILVSDSITGLQTQLNTLNTQSVRLGLEINFNKTKVMVFRLDGFLGKREKWYLGNTSLNVVNSYKYLGLDFSTKLSFSHSTSSFIAKAKQACHQISSSLYRLNCYNLDIFLNLFDSKVLPVLSYGSELWGIYENSDIERVHTNCLKHFLNISTHCSNAKLYAETNRYPLQITFKIKCIKYWLRLINLPNTRICKQAYDSLLLLSENGSENWVSRVKIYSVLMALGLFGYVRK